MIIKTNLQLRCLPLLFAIFLITVDSGISSAKQPNFVPPDLPTDFGLPGRRRSQGSRGCKYSDKEVINSSQSGKEVNNSIEKEFPVALVPSQDKGKDRYVWGYTTSANPTYWFYIPFKLRPQQDHIRLRIRNKAVGYESETFFEVGNTPGIVSLRLPDGEALVPNQPYDWFMQIYCDIDPKEALDGPTDEVSGFIFRKEDANLAQEIQSSPPNERYKLFLKNQIWHDALTNLAEAYRVKTSDTRLASDWENLLESESVQLQQLKNKPFTNCCRLKDHSQLPNKINADQ